jgi:hypothetical protein
VAAALGPDRPAPLGEREGRAVEPEIVVVDVGVLAGAATEGPEASAAVVAALARLRLAARRTGHRVRLRGATHALRALLELAGLAGEFEWQPEQREEVGGVEE